METMSKRLSQEYREYQQKFNSPPLSKRFHTKKYDEKNFKRLAKDPKAKKEVFHKTTVDEARTAIYAEIEGIVDNPQRIEQPICKSIDLDFEIDGPAPFTHMDTKHPVGSEILVKQNSPDTLQEMAYNMGKSLVKQQERFCGLEQGPESSENVLHIIDMAYVPSHEKEIVKEFQNYMDDQVKLEATHKHPNENIYRDLNLSPISLPQKAKLINCITLCLAFYF